MEPEVEEWRERVTLAYLAGWEFFGSCMNKSSSRRKYMREVMKSKRKENKEELVSFGFN